MQSKADRPAGQLLRTLRYARDNVAGRGRRTGALGRFKYMGVALAFAAALAAVFDRGVRGLADAGGDLPGALDGMFALLMPLVFAIVGVYLIVLVLHPHFKKAPMPDSIMRMRQGMGAEGRTREGIEEYATVLGSDDEEVRAYVDSFVVKADIAVTLAISLAAFFFGVYGYIRSFTIAHGGDPGMLSVSLCFMFMVFACVYTILKTMKVVWDV